MTAPHVSSGETNPPGALFMNKIAMLVGGGVVCVLAVCVTVLQALDKDTTAILAVVNIVIVPLLAALGLAKINGLERTTEAVRQQTNGSQTQQMDFTREVVQQAIAIAMSQQPQPATDRKPDSDSDTPQ